MNDASRFPDNFVPPRAVAGYSRPRYPRAWSRKPPDDGSQYVAPIPDIAPAMERSARSRAGLGPTATWTYLNADGHPLLYRLRFDTPGQRKCYRALTLWRLANGELKWRTFDPPGARPLYGLDRLAKWPKAKVIICEGEKCADAARKIFWEPKYVCITSMHGARLAYLSDWLAVAGREVIIMPDTGMDGGIYAHDVSELAYAAGALSVSLVNIKSLAALVLNNAPYADGWDIADAIEAAKTWDDQRTLREGALARVRSAPRTFLSWGDFRMDMRRGLYKLHKTKEVWVSASFKVLGHCRDPQSNDWGLYLWWRDRDSHDHRQFVSNELIYGDPHKLIALLVAGGLVVNRGKQTELANYLSGCKSSESITTVARTGWHEIDSLATFAVTPTKILDGDSGQNIVLADSAVGPYACAGTLADWQNGVGKLVADHPVPLFAVSTALSGPLLNIIGAEGGGFHFVGPSTIGKTTVALAAGSTWGRGAIINGFVRTWSATANAIEGVAASSSDTVLILDEIQLAEARDVSRVVYTLTGGVGKSRMRADTSIRDPRTWRVTIISTGEVTIATKIAEERGKTARAGQLVRLIDIAADRGKGFGVFKATVDAKALAENIKREAATNYGTAGPAFVEKLIAEGLSKVRTRVTDFTTEFVKKYVPANADPQVRRAASRFALSAVAGELAIEHGVAPWRQGSAELAARLIFAEWIKARGSVEGAEATQGVERVRLFIEQFGESRFDQVDNISERPVLNRAGWRKGKGATREWWVLPEVWKEICSGLNAVSVAQTLEEKGMLRRGKQLQAVVWVEGAARRAYVILNSIFEGGSNVPEWGPPPEPDDDVFGEETLKAHARAGDGRWSNELHRSST
jgi:putative DNA primase/helicase